MELQNASVYRLPLEKLDEPYRLDKYNELFKEEKKRYNQRKYCKCRFLISKSSDDRYGPIMDRMEQISPSFGAQFLQAVYRKGDKTTVLYTSNHGEGRNAFWKTVIEPFEQNKTEKIANTDNAVDSISSR